MKKKLLFVDDEPMSIKGLQILLDYGALGLEIVGACYNGEAALEFIGREMPDIVITDIWMPLVDGIQMMKSVYEHKWDVHIIVLSGYGEFEYAKQALDYGASGYLLKPVEKEQMEDVLRKTVAMIDEQRRLQREAELAHESEPLLKRKFLEDFIEGRLKLNEAKERAHYFNLTLYDTEVMFMPVQIDHYAHNHAFAGNAGRKLLAYAVCNIAGEILLQDGIGTAILVDNTVRLIMNPRTGILNREAIRSASDKICAQIMTCLKEPVIINETGYGDASDNANIAGAYPKEEADRLLTIMESGHQAKSDELFSALWRQSGGDACACRDIRQRSDGSQHGFSKRIRGKL